MELKEFKITVLPLRAKLLNYARKLTDEPEDAEDAVQEVLLKLWNKRLELEQYRSIEAFAMTLTHNICIDMWRCKRNDTLSLDIVQAASPTGTPERLLEIKDEIHLMHEIIDSLHHHADEGHRRIRNGRNRRNHGMRTGSHPQQSVKSPEESERRLPANHTRKKRKEK